MRKVTTGIAAFVCICAIGFGLVWIGRDQNLKMDKHFAPQEEQLRRDVFKKSEAFNSGMVQELRAMQFEYVKADKEHKGALASIIIHRAAGIDIDQLPADLQQFLTTLKRAQ